MAETAKKRQFLLTIQDVNGKDYTFAGDDAAQAAIVLDQLVNSQYVTYAGVLQFNDPTAPSTDGKGGTRYLSMKCICTWYIHDRTSTDVDLPVCTELCCLNQ